MHPALSEPSWSTAEAVVRLSRAGSSAEWAEGEIGEADLRDPGELVECRVWIDRARATWIQPAGVVRLPEERLPPLVWVRWAMDQCDPPTRRRLESAVAQWNFALTCEGKFPVMKKSGKGPNLGRYGLNGHGLPIHEFMLVEAFNVKSAWSMAIKTHTAVAPRAGRASKNAGAQAKPNSQRSRGRGVEQAVSTALDLFFAKDERLQQVLPLPASGPRYRMQNMTRKEMVKALKRKSAGLRSYKEQTIVAELSRRVIFPRGRPVHR